MASKNHENVCINLKKRQMTNNNLEKRIAVGSKAIGDHMFLVLCGHYLPPVMRIKLYHTFEVIHKDVPYTVLHLVFFFYSSMVQNKARLLSCQLAHLLHGHVVRVPVATVNVLSRFLDLTKIQDVLTTSVRILW